MKMTKLQQWLTFATLVLSVWIPTYTKHLLLDTTTSNVILLAPFVALVVFAVYSVLVIAYRVVTFNDCPEAAAEIKAEIVEARKELSDKGMKFE